MSAQAASSLKKSPAPVIFGAELRAGVVGKLPLFGKGNYAYLSTPLIFTASSRRHAGQPHGVGAPAYLWFYRPEALLEASILKVSCYMFKDHETQMLLTAEEWFCCLLGN
jgi:hypothetical protein